MGGSLANKRNSPIPRWQCCILRNGQNVSLLTYTSYLTGTKTTVLIKGVTRTARGKEASTWQTPSTVTLQSMHIPPQKVVLAVTYNKIELVDIFVETLLAQKQLALTNHKLVVTGRDPVPVEISHGMTIGRADLCKTMSP